jgi:hypothetical protein
LGETVDYVVAIPHAVEQQVHSYPDCQNGASSSETAFNQFVSPQVSEFSHRSPERSDWCKDDSVGIPNALSLNSDSDVRTGLGQRLDESCVRLGRSAKNHNCGSEFGRHLHILNGSVSAAAGWAPRTFGEISGE